MNSDTTDYLKREMIILEWAAKNNVSRIELGTKFVCAPAVISVEFYPPPQPHYTFHPMGTVKPKP